MEHTMEWKGGDPKCDHMGNPMATAVGLSKGYDATKKRASDSVKINEKREFFKTVCGKCGAGWPRSHHPLPFDHAPKRGQSV